MEERVVPLNVENGDQDHLVEVKQEKQNRFIPVKAYFISTSIDLSGLQNHNTYNVIPPNSRAANYTVLRYCDVRADTDGLESHFSDESNSCYMVVFQYGSVVLFNIAEHEVDGYFKIVQKHASGLLSELKKMVDGMVAEFTDINRGMENTGTFTMQRKKLFQLVGKANSNLADVILKIGLFERSDIAWRNANYAQIWEYLRDEYELTQRFSSLDFKLKFVEHNIRFLQEILQNRRSEFLEWLIIILIGVEILISVYNIFQESKLSSIRQVSLKPAATVEPVDRDAQEV